MKPFLQQVASHYSTQSLKGTCFVFPSRRAARFFRHHLEQVSGEKMHVFCTSMNEFLHRSAGVDPTDRLTLMTELHAAYTKVNPDAESLDQFLFWGDVILNDFDDTDKYCSDVRGLFLNVSDWKNLDSQNLDFLTEGQREAVKHFLDHFCEGVGDEGGVKHRFARIWDLLQPLYEPYRESLSVKGLAYEGMVYRSIADRIAAGESVRGMMREPFPYVRRFVFIGLNVLSQSEKVVLKALRDAGMAEFCWDYSSAEIKDPANKSSLFMGKNVQEFPQAFALDTEGLSRPTVNVVGVPSAVGQTKLAPAILSSLQGDASQTAFILPDESLLKPLLNAIPASFEEINVTMGAPLRDTGLYAFMKAAMRIPMGIREKDGKDYVHHSCLDDAFSTSLFKEMLSEEERLLVEDLRADGKHFIAIEEVAKGETLSRLFRRCGECTPSELTSYIGDILSLVKEHTPDDEEHEAQNEYLRRYGEAVATLASRALPVSSQTWIRLLDKALRGISIPFEGDPFKGLQVMGPLETRAMDYRNVVILSANEDMFPKRSFRPSFIPPALRQGFGLPTPEMQDALWAYYFYRLLQRAENVWMTYDSRTDGMLSGEESRYIKQLELHFGFPLRRIDVVSSMHAVTDSPVIPKTEEDVEAVRNGRLSASSLQNYIVCPAKFYYQNVKGLREKSEAKDALDAAMIGNVFHGVMEELYRQAPTVTQQRLQNILRNRPSLTALIRRKILEEMNTIEVTGRNLVIESVLTDYVEAAVRHDLGLLRAAGQESFRILGLEKRMTMTIDGFQFIGYIDRLDCFSEDTVRVVDYKTGHVEDDDIHITDKNAQAVAEKLFGESNYGRPKIALQLYLYDQFVKNAGYANERTVINSIYSTGRLMTRPLEDCEESPVFEDEMKERVSRLLGEIADTSVPWKRTCDRSVCAMCPFASICGR